MRRDDVEIFPYLPASVPTGPDLLTHWVCGGDAAYCQITLDTNL